jgi:hypothetical protein
MRTLPSNVHRHSHILCADPITMKFFVISSITVIALLTYATARPISAMIDLDDPTSQASNRNFTIPNGGSLSVHFNNPQEMQEVPVPTGAEMSIECDSESGCTETLRYPSN